jgi:hypothetical protein
MIFKANRDGLIRSTPSETIMLGQKLAQDFRPTNFSGLNPVEADLLFAELNLSSIYRINGGTSAVINNVRFAANETKELKIDGQPVILTCLAIDARSSTFAIASTSYQAVLQLKH